jgi:hypothetical protein
MCSTLSVAYRVMRLISMQKVNKSADKRSRLSCRQDKRRCSGANDYDRCYIVNVRGVGEFLIECE